MNYLIEVLVVFIVVVAVIGDEKYTTKYDNVNLREILNNKRLLKGYTNCLLEKGPCSPDGTELKKVLPDAIETNCAKCSDKQRSGSREILRHLINKEPEIWNQLENKYDPKGTYRLRYKEDAEKEGFNL